MSRAVSLCGDPATLVNRKKNQLCDYMTTEPARVSWDTSIVMPGSRVEIFHVITLAGPPGELTKRETGQRVTHCSCALLRRSFTPFRRYPNNYLMSLGNGFLMRKFVEIQQRLPS